MKQVMAAENFKTIRGERSSNIELFRIISMLFIVAHHYVVNSGLLDCIEAQTVLTFKDYFLLLIGWGGKTGINCFVLITGYYMCKSDITIKKFLKLLGEVEFYNIAIFAVFCLTGYEAFSITGAMKAIFPFFNISKGFTSCFLLFYLLIPFLNKLIHVLKEKEHIQLIIWCLLIFTVLPSFVKANVTYNYITWFGVLYITASYIRLYPKKWFENYKLVGSLAFATIMLSWTSVFFLAFISRVLDKEIGISYFFVADSNKVLALITAVFGFLFFRHLKIEYSKIINTFAASTFGVLLIHANSDTMRQWLWKDVCNGVNVYERDYWGLHAIGCVVAIYIICSLIDMFRIRFIEKRYLIAMETMIKNLKISINRRLR